MYHPTSRVLTVLELLQSKPSISGPELASRLEVDVRTVRRYILMLQDVGIPVEAVIGRYGGYRLRPGFKLPPLMFSNDEVLALTLGLMLVQKVGVDTMTPTVERVMAKIERVLPAPLRKRVQTIRETLIVDTISSDVLVRRIVVETMSIAAQECHQVRLRYRTDDTQETERVIDPYGVVCHNGRWYTVGYCHLRLDLRVFRLDRVQQIEILEETFTCPPDFPALEYIVQSFAAIPDTWDIEVLLMMSLEEARHKVPATLATLEQDAQGVILRASLDNLDWMARFLVGLGCSFVIRQPAELRTILQELAAEMISMAQWPTEVQNGD